MNEAVLELDGVERIYRQADENLKVLKGVELSIARGELVALVGPSGAGKSTLLHVAGLLEHPESGEVSIAGKPCSALDDNARTELRRTKIGFVYQFHHLLPEFSALENVMIPRMVAGEGRRAARSRARKLIEAVGLSARSGHRPAKLSGGEQQRVAIARALANDPSVLLADEPTGNLDSNTADAVFELLKGLVREAGLGALLATHNMELARRMDRTLRLEEGIIRLESIDQ
ncbi:MAG: Lipoprotein-releasing system ATP-binding protein LolD [Alphaproteobacteria bacterium MarineAlpha4_Bin2]|nr:MAG: Lipoprotein-releasing system ATP-binding protein LolD [Alphaproteobacteria bacterium MarineAlpha4_Bin2]